MAQRPWINSGHLLKVSEAVRKKCIDSLKKKHENHNSIFFVVLEFGETCKQIIGGNYKK